MKNQTRNLVIISIAFVLLIGGYFFIKNRPIKEEEEIPQIQNENEVETVVWNFEEKDFKSLYIKNPDDEYTIIDAGDGLVVEELLGYKKESTSYSFIETIFSMVATKEIIKDVDDLKKFGLDKPELILKMSWSNKEVKLSVGNVTPEQNSRYAQVEGESKILVISTALLRPLYNDRVFYLSKRLTPLDPQKEYDINKLALSGSSQSGKNMVIEKNKIDENSPTAAYQPPYRLSSPVGHEVITDRTTEFIATVLNLVAIDIENISATNEELVNYGFENPIAVIEVDYYEVTPEDSEEVVGEQGNFSFSVGDKNEEGMYFVRTTEGNTVYLVASDALSFIDTNYTDYMSPLLLLPYINDVKEVEITLETPLEDGKRKITFNHILTVTPATEKEEERTELSVNESGKEITDIASYKTLYQLLIGVQGEVALTDQIREENISKAPVVTISYIYYEQDRNRDVVKLIPLDQRNLLVSVNDEAHFSMRSAYLDKLVSSLETVLSGEKLESADW